MNINTTSFSVFPFFFNRFHSTHKASIFKVYFKTFFTWLSVLLNPEPATKQPPICNSILSLWLLFSPLPRLFPRSWHPAPTAARPTAHAIQMAVPASTTLLVPPASARLAALLDVLVRVSAAVLLQVALLMVAMASTAQALPVAVYVPPASLLAAFALFRSFGNWKFLRFGMKLRGRKGGKGENTGPFRDKKLYFVIYQYDFSIQHREF